MICSWGFSRLPLLAKVRLSKGCRKRKTGFIEGAKQDQRLLFDARFLNAISGKICKLGNWWVPFFST